MNAIYLFEWMKNMFSMRPVGFYFVDANREIEMKKYI